MRPLVWFCFAASAFGQGPTFIPRLDEPRIGYYAGEAHDLASEVSDGLEFKAPWGYLESLLRELHIPVSSQTLVFSKTSFQVSRISPDHPRALYFSDDVYVGMVRGGFLEIAAVDPQRGAVFYELENKPSAHPRLQRRNEECLNCHFSVNTMSVPGFLTRSVVTDNAGEPNPAAGSYLTDHRSPLSQRWGGWYVTGAEDSVRHMGKARGPKGGQYPTASSDITALLVLNHQVRMHNLITRVGYEARLNRPELPDTIEATLRYLLFADEAPLREPTSAVAPFRADFEARGPEDRKGRSLRQMDLKTRLFRYPCSFLIYSASFDALPARALDPLYRRLFEVLTGADQSPVFASLKSDDRRAILEILIDTKPSLPGYFRAAR